MLQWVQEKQHSLKHLLKKLEATEQGQSPSFGIVNEYPDAQGNTLAYHFDLYRLNKAEEALDFGIEEYLAFDGWIFIEVARNNRKPAA